MYICYTDNDFYTNRFCIKFSCLLYEGQRCNYRQVWLIKERYSHIKLRYSTALFFDLTKRIRALTSCLKHYVENNKFLSSHLVYIYYGIPFNREFCQLATSRLINSYTYVFSLIYIFMSDISYCCSIFIASAHYHLYGSYINKNLIRRTTLLHLRETFVTTFIESWKHNE